MSSLFSQSWYLVRDLKVHLRQHVDVHRHQYRGDIWYVLQDHATGQFHRFTPAAYCIIGLFDGHQTLQQIWEKACEQLGDDMPSQDEVVDLVSRLFRANVLQSDVMPDIQKLDYRRKSQARKKFLMQLMSPLSIRIPLWDPERFLNRTQFVARFLFSFWGAAIWLTVVGYGLVLAGIHWQQLTGNTSDQILAAKNLLLISMVYPVVKVIHELGHAWAVKRWGGEVHEIGIMFLVFFPIPYVDASAATAFSGRYQRVLVGAAGILVELFIAALAMIFWASAEPGLARSLAFNTMLIAGVSTLLFNGNPLLKFDAYYMLADWLEIPNFGQKANQYIGYLTKKYLAGVEGLVSPAKTFSERLWLGGYAIAAYCYRLLIMMAIALFIASTYFFIGVLLAIWVVFMSLAKPLITMVLKPIKDARLKEHRKRIFTLASLIGLTAVVFLGVIPFPYNTLAEGVLRPTNDSMVRAGTHGFTEDILMQDGMPVEQGDLLIRMTDPTLQTQTRALKARVDEARASYQANLSNRVESDLNRARLQYAMEEFENVRQRQQSLEVYANHSGQFVVADPESLYGQYFERGAVLGYVVDFSTLPVLVLVHEDQIDKIRSTTISTEIRKVSEPEKNWHADILRIMPASTTELPSVVLTSRGGGKIALAANAGDELRSHERYFRLELEVDGELGAKLDERLYVLFRHQPEPLIKRWYRSVRRVFLRQFDV